MPVKNWYQSRTGTSQEPLSKTYFNGDGHTYIHTNMVHSRAHVGTCMYVCIILVAGTGILSFVFEQVRACVCMYVCMYNASSWNGDFVVRV